MPPRKWECVASDRDGPIELKSDQQIQEHEKRGGVKGMLDWCQRVMEDAEASRVEVRLRVKEKEEPWVTLMEVEFIKGRDGFIRFKGAFPITIT